jgi:hypothetical protein
MSSRAILLLAALVAGGLQAQGPIPREREWCPRPDLCIDDRLEVVFQNGGSDFEIDEFVPGTKVIATVVMDTKSDGVQGWSYGVRHDPEILRLVSGRLLIQGSCEDCSNPFLRPVFECVGADPRCTDRKEGGGFINAVVLSLIEDRNLDVGRNALALAEYELLADPGPEGTLIEFTDRLALKNSPPAAINITVRGPSSTGETRTGTGARASPTPSSSSSTSPSAARHRAASRRRTSTTAAAWTSRTRSPSSTGFSGAGPGHRIPDHPLSPARPTHPRAPHTSAAVLIRAVDPRNLSPGRIKLGKAHDHLEVGIYNTLSFAPRSEPPGGRAEDPPTSKQDPSP